MINTYQNARRVVVTGLGILAPNGLGKDAFWSSLINAETGIEPVTLFDATELRSRIAGEVKPFDYSTYIPDKFRPGRMGRASIFAIVSSKLALADAGLDTAEFDPDDPFFISLGVSTSALDTIEKQTLEIHTKGWRHAHPYTVRESLPNAVACNVADVLNVKADAVTISNGCPSGISAINEATQKIRSGKYDFALAGASDSPITYSAMAAFCAARALSERNEDPATASRPFDADRDGGVLAEGAAVFVLEEYERAVARGVTPYLEILGHGSMNDTPESTPGSALEETMDMAIANSSIYPEQIDYINAHGPSDREIDAEEVRCIKSLFGNHANRLKIASIKGVTGNPLSAAGALQVGCCAMAFRKQQIPPTANFTEPDEDSFLEGITNQSSFGTISHALINIHGYGGINNSLVVKRFPA